MEDEENFLLLNISIFSPLLKVHPLRISFNFWRFSLGKNGSIRPSLNRKSWIREARVIHSRGIFQTLNQNFLRFGIKDPCKLGNVNSIKGRDSFSRKFPQRKISVRGESSSCYARPVSRMDNGEPVEREQRRVEGGGAVARSGRRFSSLKIHGDSIPFIFYDPRSIRSNWIRENSLLFVGGRENVGLATHCRAGT